MDISLRKAVASDLDFLIELRNNTMRGYLKEAGIPTSLDAYLSRVQFKFEHAQIIILDGLPIGLFKAEYQEDNNRWDLIQIQVHPAYQNLKIGSVLIRALIQKARASRSCVALKVIKTNPAYRLYQRLGFERVAENNVEYELELQPISAG